MRLPLWLTGLLVTTCIQVAGSYMSQSLPVIAPLLTQAAGVGREQAGVMYALYMAGTIVFLACFTPLLNRFGPLRAMRLGLLAGTCALALVSVGQWPVIAAASLLLGVAYGPCPPGSTRILATTALPRHRALMFSIKQAGAQVGGVVAGLTIAPVASVYGWSAGLIPPIILGLTVSLLAGLARRPLEAVRDPPRPVTLAGLFGPHAFKAPFAAVAASPALMVMTLITASLAVVQSCLFSFCVTWLVTVHGMTLTHAGMIYACMQGGSTLGRIAAGWASDRSQNVPRDLILQSWASAILVLVWTFLPPGTTVWILAPLAFTLGVTAASWPGLILSEVSRLAPPGRVADAASGSSMITFAGYVAGPFLFSWLVRLSGGWTVPYGLVAAQAVAVGLLWAAWPNRRLAS